MNNDKQTECLRYEKQAQFLLADENLAKKVLDLGSSAIPPIYRAPYIYYEQCIQNYISKNYDVLELGSGTGIHTGVLLKTGANVVATDISPSCLEVLKRRFEREVVKTHVADMEALPFGDNSFDAVTSAGSLSYGDPDLVDKEIIRVLRPGGIFICVDSLNHNPIYRFNRWIHYLRGLRTKSTLLCMPTMERIQLLSKRFKNADVRYFGAISYFMPILARIIGQNNAAKVSDAFDQLVNVSRTAFKFVLVAQGRL